MTIRRLLAFVLAGLLMAMPALAVGEQATPAPAPGLVPAPDATAAQQKWGSSTEGDQSISWTTTATPAPAAPGRTGSENAPDAADDGFRDGGILSGHIIGIDPGHQAKGNSEQETIAPDSTETKAKVSSGTQGVASGVPEHEVNLNVSLMLREALENLGATVYMTRETADVDISNQERAKMMNELGCELVLRIHCNGVSNSEHTGIGTYVRATGEGADESALAAEYVLDAMCEATGAKRDGVFLRDTYTGLNWSTVPSMIVEMGYMSNPEEDMLLNDPEYQEMLVTGMIQGIIQFLLHPEDDYAE